MIRKAIYLLLSLTMMLGAASCSRGKHPEKSSDTGSVSVSGNPAYAVDKATGAAYLKSVSERYLSWQQVKVPVSVKLSSPKSLSISGTAEMVRDSSVLISLKFIGMEVAWLYVSNGRIIIADKMNKRYIDESPKQFLGGFDVTTANLQDLLIGRPFVLGSGNLSETAAGQFTFTADGSGAWSLQPHSPLEQLEYGFWFEPQLELNAAVVQYEGKKPVALLYGSPVDTPAGAMASQLSLKADVVSAQVDLTIYWNWQRAKWNDSFSPRAPKVPDNYRKVDGATVIKSLGGNE